MPSSLKSLNDQFNRRLNSITQGNSGTSIVYDDSYAFCAKHIFEAHEEDCHNVADILSGGYFEISTNPSPSVKVFTANDAGIDAGLFPIQKASLGREVLDAYAVLDEAKETYRRSIVETAQMFDPSDSSSSFKMSWAEYNAEEMLEIAEIVFNETLTSAFLSNFGVESLESELAYEVLGAQHALAAAESEHHRYQDTVSYKLKTIGISEKPVEYELNLLAYSSSVLAALAVKERAVREARMKLAQALEDLELAVVANDKHSHPQPLLRATKDQLNIISWAFPILFPIYFSGSVSTGARSKPQYEPHARFERLLNFKLRFFIVIIMLWTALWSSYVPFSINKRSKESFALTTLAGGTSGFQTLPSGFPLPTKSQFFPHHITSSRKESLHTSEFRHHCSTQAARRSGRAFTSDTKPAANFQGSIVKFPVTRSAAALQLYNVTVSMGRLPLVALAQLFTALCAFSL